MCPWRLVPSLHDHVSHRCSLLFPPPPHSRLAKSTLTLIPLLGIHHVVFIFLTDESTTASSSLRLTKLFIDLFLSSFQVEMKCFAVSLSNSCFELFCF